ncbi:MAG: M6 family metalloprotease domain-containing protein [Bacteroidales bacterium]|nr:M6 family metalloprotease domain-containing protein [Bacteroidales bacterium]
MTLVQPNGDTLHCFASGDEFFNYLHDAEGFTIIQHPETGFYVYAEKRDGKLVATDFVAGKVRPTSKGLEPYALISPEEWMARRKAWEVPNDKPRQRTRETNHGTLNNIVIFIRFSDDSEFTNTYSSIDNMFNAEGEDAVSMKNYFEKASYGAIDIPTTFYPGHNGNTIISYQDTQKRKYFQPYNKTSNPIGYQGGDDGSERMSREHALLKRAVDYVNANYPIPSNLNIDYDNDGYVDNVCFIVRGGVGAWSSLLWPHQWSLSNENAYINGKRVWTFNFQLADATNYFNTSTMCHEMNHSLGAPDLYHYYYGKDIRPAGGWDLMEQNAMPPQHCGAYMKWRYSNWIDEIPEITEPGTYTLNPISSPTPENICYKIASGKPGQYYVLEYRDNTSTFEAALPGSGLLIYRIDSRFDGDGNQNYNPSEGIYDEVYIYRPGGTMTANGTLNNAYFSANSGRTEFNASTNPKPFYTDGTVDENFGIYDVTTAGNTISFSYGSLTCDPPTDLTATVSHRDVALSWNGVDAAASYIVYKDGFFIGNTENTTYIDENVTYGTHSYTVKCKDASGRLSASSNATEVTIVYLGPIPENLTGTVSGMDVTLSWVAPENHTSTLCYGVNNLKTSIGTGSGGLYWGQRFDVATLQSNINMAIDSVSFFAPYYGTKTTLLIYKVVNEMYMLQTSFDFYPESEYEWNVVHLPQPVLIDHTNDLVVAFYSETERYPASACGYSGNGYEGLVSFDGSSWSFIKDQGFEVSWLIKTHISYGSYTYNVYRNDSKVNDEAVTSTNYVDEDLLSDASYQYRVKTVYYGMESNPSNLVGFSIGDTELVELTLSDDDKMTVTQNAKLSVSGTLTNANAENLILEDGAQLIHNSAGVMATVQKNITGYGTGEGNWYLIASPMANNVSTNPFVSDYYDLYRYNEPTHYWWNSKTPTSGEGEEGEDHHFDELTNGVGYLYGNGIDCTLSLSGELRPSVNDVDIPLSYTSSLNTLKGFNLIGNPFPCQASVSGNIAEDFYVMNETRDELEVSHDNVVNPFEGIFVQATGENANAAFSRVENNAKGRNVSSYFDVIVNEGRSEIDRARVRMGEGNGLGKFSLNENSARIYVSVDKQDYASAYVSGRNVLPLNFEPAKNGTYTLDFDLSRVDLDYLHLIDNLTGADVDLMAAASKSSASYSFDAKTTDYASRFKLVFAEKQQADDSENTDFMYYSDGKLFILSAEEKGILQIVDAVGRVIMTENVNGYASKSLSLKPGVYVARMICGDVAKMQKFVAK